MCLSRSFGVQLHCHGESGKTKERAMHLQVNHHQLGSQPLPHAHLAAADFRASPATLPWFQGSQSGASTPPAQAPRPPSIRSSQQNPWGGLTQTTSALAPSARSPYGWPNLHSEQMPGISNVTSARAPSSLQPHIDSQADGIQSQTGPA